MSFVLVTETTSRKIIVETTDQTICNALCNPSQPLITCLDYLDSRGFKLISIVPNGFTVYVFHRERSDVSVARPTYPSLSLGPVPLTSVTLPSLIGAPPSAGGASA